MAQAYHDAQDAYNRYLVNTHGIDPRSPKAREANKKLDETLRRLAISMLPPTHPGYRAPPAHPRGGRRKTHNKTRNKTRKFHGGKPPGTVTPKFTPSNLRDPVLRYQEQRPPGPPLTTEQQKTVRDSIPRRGGHRKTRNKNRRSRRAY